MATGREMKDAYNAVKAMCFETQALIVFIRDRMRNLGFETADGKRVMWDTSTSFANPAGWMPYFQQVMFTSGDKTGPGSKKGMGINIMWDAYGDQLGDHLPFVTVGVCHMRNGAPSQCDEMYYAGWGEDSHRLQDTKVLYETMCDKGSVEKIISYFLPLESLTDEATVEDLVVRPLLLLYSGEVSDADKSLEGKAVLVETVAPDSR